MPLYTSHYPKAHFLLGDLVRATRAKTRIWRRDWLKLAGEKTRCEQEGTVPTFLSARANKFVRWKIGFKQYFKKLVSECWN